MLSDAARVFGVKSWRLGVHANLLTEALVRAGAPSTAVITARTVCSGDVAGPTATRIITALLYPLCPLPSLRIPTYAIGMPTSARCPSAFVVGSFDRLCEKQS